LVKFKCNSITWANKILNVLCYRQPQMRTEVRVWEKFLEQLKDKFFIGRNFNGHHNLLGDFKSCNC
jgi:hypothetical protein